MGVRNIPFTKKDAQSIGITCIDKIIPYCIAYWQKQKEKGYVMNTTVRLMLVCMLMVVAAPAYAAQPTQMWKCEVLEDFSEEEVIASAGEWLKAARTMKGGERLEAYVYFPVAVNAIGEADVWFVVTAPSFEEWGKFWDNYAGSPAAAVDQRNQKVDCPNSALWEAVKIE